MFASAFPYFEADAELGVLPDIIPPLEVGVVLNLQPSRSRPHMCLHLSPRCAYHHSVGVGDRVTLYLAPGK